MFLIMGMSSGRKVFNFNQLTTCAVCGQYGRYNVFMTYKVFTIFFIPTIKWNKRYYVQTSCCGTIYELDREIGKMIAKGETVEILPSNLRMMQRGRYYNTAYKRCRQCGCESAADYAFCPRCGARI
ncbi:hypothetical protein SAMN06296386_11484 [Lachnospiraceae bacterium]|nr:hypothetical protein SAMN06296386_11484 [Lachnospiraceae bacterium]